MKHVKALALKVIAILLICWLILTLLYDVAFLDAAIAGLIISLAIYIVGDLFILRKFGNFAAVICDLGAAFLILWVYLPNAGYTDNTILMSFFASILIGLWEAFFHKWLLKQDVVPDERRAV